MVWACRSAGEGVGWRLTHPQSDGRFSTSAKVQILDERCKSGASREEGGS